MAAANLHLWIERRPPPVDTRHAHKNLFRMFMQGDRTIREAGPGSRSYPVADPLKGSTIPVDRWEDPVVYSTGPVVCSAKPVVWSTGPVVCSAGQVVCSTKPVVCSADPVVCSAKPVVCSADPVVCSLDPVVYCVDTVVRRSKPAEYGVQRVGRSRVPPGEQTTLAAREGFRKSESEFRQERLYNEYESFSSVQTIEAIIQ